jgi:hypothetical protein
MRFATMPTQAQAAVLQLDPLVDRGEYNHFLHLMADSGPQDVDRVVALMRQGGPDGRRWPQRIENLGMPDWEVWAAELRSAAEVVDGGARATVLDLSGFRDLAGTAGRLPGPGRGPLVARGTTVRPR